MRRSAAGFTLIEALIALLVLTIGLLGAAGMLLTSVRNSHNSYLRSQAGFIADSLVERMRANPLAIWNAKYDGKLDAKTPATSACGASGCTPAEVAAFDRAAIARMISQHLPSGSGEVACKTTGAAPVRNFGISPVNGECRITIRWHEKRDVDAGGFAGTQSFEMVVQP